MVTFIVFGRALLKAIDKSLQNQKQQTLVAKGCGEGAKDGAGSHTLSEAKRKVKLVVVVETVMMSSSCLFAFPILISGLDLDMPLMFGTTVAYLPLMWLAFNVHVHGGRSGSHRRPAPPTSSGHAEGLGLSGRKTLFSSTKQEKKVVPTEVPC